MQGNGTGQFRSHIQNFLVPAFTHAAGIDKDQRGPAFLNNRNHFIDQFDSEMTRPGIFFNFIRNNGFNFNSFIQFCFYDNRRITDFIPGWEKPTLPAPVPGFRWLLKYPITVKLYGSSVSRRSRNSARWPVQPAHRAWIPAVHAIHLLPDKRSHLKISG